jgi:hypothetical protein
MVWGGGAVGQDADAPHVSRGFTVAKDQSQYSERSRVDAPGPVTANGGGHRLPVTNPALCPASGG